MSSNSPSSPENDSSMPPRHRPPLEKIVKDSTEADLWAFDEPDELDTKPNPPPKKSRTNGIPSPRTRSKTTAKAQETTLPMPEKAAAPESNVQVNVGRSKTLPPAPSIPQAISGPEFADLDHWDETVLPVSSPTTYVPVQPALMSVDEMPVAPVAVTAREVTANLQAPQQKAIVKDDFDEFSSKPPPGAEPISLIPVLKLSKVEKIGLIAFLVVLAIAAIVASIFSLDRLPTSSNLTLAADFPVETKLLTIEKVDTYWREPITNGPKTETFRRGTRLLPVVTLAASKGAATLRFLFRDGDQQLIGDAVTRDVIAGTTIEVAATAGFEDTGMHAAYRTGEAEPWTIEVYEGATENSKSNEFIKILEMSISTERR